MFSGFLSVVFLILAVLLLFAFILRNRSIKQRVHSPVDGKLHILNVDKGGVFTITGVGEDSEEMTLKVIAKHLYREGDFYWFELECDKGTGEKVWVEVEDDDETVVSVMLKKLKLSDLGINSSTLNKIDDNESGSITYRGVRYNYEDSDSAIFYKFCDDKNPKNFYYWDFVNNSHILSVEKWDDNAMSTDGTTTPDNNFKSSYEVSLSQKMKPSQITILSNKSEE